MPPPGCPIPEWVYPGRVLMSRQNSNAYVWIDSIRYAETGDFYITLRQVLSFAPTVVNRFCVTEAWALGLFEETYEPTDQWEPFPQFAWDENLENEFIDGDHTCEIALRDGTRTWNIESLGVEGSRMTLGVSREVVDEEVPDGEMEAIEEPDMTERQQQLFDLRGAQPGNFVRNVLPHLMAPPATRLPLNQEEADEQVGEILDDLMQREDAMITFHAALQATHPEASASIREGCINAVSMGTRVPYQPDAPQNNGLSVGQPVRLVGGGLIGVVVAITPSGVQVNTHDGFNSIVEFEHGALEPYRASEAPAEGSLIRAPNGVVIGRVVRVIGTDVTWSTSDGRIFTNTEENLREQGGRFEATNLWVGPRPQQPVPQRSESPRPTVYDRILEDDDD